MQRFVSCLRPPELVQSREAIFWTVSSRETVRFVLAREGEQIFEGGLASLKRFKDDVKEVKAGYECGLVFEGFNDVQEDGSGRGLYYGRGTKIGIRIQPDRNVRLIRIGVNI